MTPLLAAWIAEVVLITYRNAAQGTGANNPVPHLPLPSSYASSFIVYGALALVPGEQGGKAAALVGWGFVVATLLNLWNPTGTVKTTPQVQTTPATTTAPATMTTIQGATP